MFFRLIDDYDLTRYQGFINYYIYVVAVIVSLIVNCFISKREIIINFVCLHFSFFGMNFFLLLFGPVEVENDQETINQFIDSL